MIERVESFLGDHIEGFFNRKFSSHLEPVELIKGLEKEVKKQGAGKGLANSYVISLGTEDYQRLCSHRVADELAPISRWRGSSASVLHWTKVCVWVLIILERGRGRNAPP